MSGEMIGQTIGNYVVTREVGRGGMGAVYLAEHPRIKKQVAVKVLLPELSEDPGTVQRFFTEARSATEIKNEHIIDVIDFGESAEGFSYIVMEWLEGRSLGDVIDREGPLPLERTLHILAGIADALAAAHEKGITHRDLKPDNIFLVNRGGDPDFVKVLDFGVAKLAARHDETGDGITPGRAKTETGALIGTPSYMSPEQCRGHNVDYRTDLYALGVITFEMLTKQLPFVAEGLGDLLLAHMTEQPVAPSALRPDIPEHVELAILAALEKQAQDRFQSAAEMLAALRGEKKLQRHPQTARVHIIERKQEIDPIAAGAQAGKRTIAAGGAGASAVAAPTDGGSTAPRAAWVVPTIAVGALGVIGVVVALLWPAPPAPPEKRPEPIVTSTLTPNPTPTPTPNPTPNPTPTPTPTAPTPDKLALPLDAPITPDKKNGKATKRDPKIVAATPAAKPEPKPDPKGDPKKPIYTGKKGTLVSEFPE